MSDFRDAARALGTTPVVTAVAILSLALGIGASTAIFSILDSLILRALPVQEPQRLVQITEGESRSWTNPIWEQIRDRQTMFDGAFAFTNTRFNLSQGGQAEFVDGIWASGGYFDALGVTAVLGRTFGAADDRRGGGPDGPVTVISYGFWQRRFAGAADAVGRSLLIERVPFTIIGVTPPDFFGTEVGRTFDVAIPLGTEPLIRGKESALDRRSTWWLRIMLRLTPGQTVESAAATLAGVQPQIRDATVPEHYREQDKAEYLTGPFTLVPAATGDSRLRQRYQQPLATIMVVVGLVLLIACANIANLLLARATARRHELCVRLALGATRFRLTRQLLTESLLLSGLGALLGLAFAYWGSQALVRQLSTSTSTVFLNLSLDWRVLGFTAAIATLTAVLFGTAPALRAARVQPSEAMKEKGRGVVGEGRLGLGALLVVVQVALSLVLLVGAGLFVRTFNSLATLDLGFDRGPLLVAGLDVQALQLEPAERALLFDTMRRASAAVPGVARVAASVVTPVSGSTWTSGVEMEDAPRMTDREREVFVNLISPDWFRTYNTPLISGRDFTDADTRGAPEVAIVNEAFARKFTSGENPVGRRIREPGFGGRPTVHRQIVGYVRDAVYRSLREPVPPTMYVPVVQHERIPTYISLSVRAAAGSPVLLSRSLASTLTAINPGVSITFRPLAEQVDNSLIQERLVAMLSGFFGALALLLAGLGLYGVTSYAVSRRRTEIGIRMALGATPRGVVSMVLGRVGMLVGAGVLAGATIAFWASRFVEALLYGLKPWDPITVGAAIVALAVIGMLAGLVPARRASRIDPAQVLREG